MDISVQRTAHSQRHKSVFPPLLRSDAEQESERCTRGYNQKTENEKSQQYAQTEDHSRRKETLTQCVQKWRANGKAKKMASGNEREEELLKRKHERAEALAKKWDLLQVKEKEEKYTRLLQRLELQHKLIAKRDLLSKQLEREAKEKHVKELQSCRDFKKQMMQDLRDHNKRVNEHKKMVAEKLRESEGFRKPFHGSSDPSPELHLKDPVEESIREQATPYHSDGRPSSSQRGHSRLQQLLHFDPIREATPTIPVAWKTLKHDNERRLLPFVEYSLFTRKFASPTSRHLLRCYDQPVRVNSKNGERLPLLEVMEREAQLWQTGTGAQSIITNALELKTHRNQAKAEVLLHRKQAQVDVPIQEPTMYLPTDEYTFLDNNETQHLSEKQPLETVSVKCIPTARQTKKRLPKYLMEDGTLVSGSLEQIGKSRIYCRPAIGNSTQTMNASKPTILNNHNREMTTTARPRWQPLSSSAALEYEGTCAVPMKVFNSSSGHGKYSMWKPLSSHTSHAQNV